MISKRANDLDKVKEVVVSLWDQGAGPLENILGLASYFIPFVPGLGWVVFAAEKIASYFGYGLNDLGRYLDQELGLGPGSDLNVGQKAKIQQVLQYKVKAAKYNGAITKQAFFGALLAKGVPAIVKGIFMIVKVILLALAIEKVSDIYDYVKQYGAQGLSSDLSIMFQQLPNKPSGASK